jgi:hypothetical protein
MARERTKGCACCTADAKARIVEALQEVGFRGVGLGSEASERADRSEADFFGRIEESASQCRDCGRSAPLEDSSGQGTSRGCFFHESLFEGEACFGAEIKQRTFGEFSDMFIRRAQGMEQHRDDPIFGDLEQAHRKCGMVLSGLVRRLKGLS